MSKKNILDVGERTLDKNEPQVSSQEALTGTKRF